MRWGIRQSKSHPLESVESGLSHESTLVRVALCNLDVIVSASNIKLGEKSALLHSLWGVGDVR